jgi:hypothetical protein
MLDESSGACRNQKARIRAMKRELEHSIKSFLSRLAIKLRLLLPLEMGLCIERWQVVDADNSRYGLSRDPAFGVLAPSRGRSEV